MSTTSTAAPAAQSAAPSRFRQQLGHLVSGTGGPLLGLLILCLALFAWSIHVGGDGGPLIGLS